MMEFIIKVAILEFSYFQSIKFFFTDFKGFNTKVFHQFKLKKNDSKDQGLF